MASRKILVQLDIAAASNLTSPLSGFVGFSAKADGLYQKIGTAPELRLLTSADVQNAILADGSITGAVSQAQIFTMGVKLYNLTQGYIPYASDSTKLLSNSQIYTDGANVGIGTTTPMAKLEVYNNAAHYASTLALVNNPNIAFRIKSRGTFNTTLAVGAIGDPDKIGFQAFDSSLNTAKDILLNPFGGNVGIGINNPSAKLDIESSSTSSPATLAIGIPTGTAATIGTLKFQRGSADYAWAGIVGFSTFTDQNGLAFYTTPGGTVAATERMRIAQGGNVGIGTTNPRAKLQVESTDSIFNFRNPTTYYGSAADIIIGAFGFNNKANDNGNTKAFAFRTSKTTAHATQSDVKFHIDLLREYSFDSATDSSILTGSKITALTLDGSGNIGIGTPAPNQQLEITKNFRLPSTTGTTPYGIIYKGSTPFIHDFNYGNNGTVTTEGRNTFVGINAGNLTMGSTATQVYHASYNTGIGSHSLYYNTTGNQNTANGSLSLYSNTTGSNNTANGSGSLFSNTTGSNNVAIGYNTLRANTVGNNNIALGLNALYNTAASSNTAIGYSSLFSNTSGGSNTALGFYAGYYLANGTTGRATGNNGLYLGTHTKASADGTDNETVIGYNAIGVGSNKTVIGNSSVTDTYFGSSTGSSKLWASALNLSSLTASKVVFTDSSKNLTSTGIGTAAQFIKGDGSLDSNTYLTSGSISGFVPYTGAIQNVNIGTFGLHSGYVAAGYAFIGGLQLFNGYILENEIGIYIDDVYKLAAFDALNLIYSYGSNKLRISNSGDVSIDKSLTIGNTNTSSYTDGGYLSVTMPIDSYAKLNFYSKDTFDGFGITLIIANPEEGISLRAISNDNSSDSYLEVRHWELGFYTNLQKRLEIAQNGSINAFGNTITSTGGFIGNASTATKLQTARTITIGNQSLSFDGTANLTYSLSGIGIPVGTASQYIRGDLSLATFPTIISGSGAPSHITLWNGVHTQTSNANLTFNSVDNLLSTYSIYLAYNFKLGSSTTAGYVLTADANGKGTWQAPTGSIIGSGVSDRVTFWNGTNSLSSSNDLRWNDMGKILNVTGDIVVSNSINSASAVIGSVGTELLSTNGFRLLTSITAGYVLTTDVYGNGTWQAPPTGGGSYTLPTATASVLGGVKIGSGITISSGTISIVSSIYNQYASAQTANAWINGYIRLGENLVLSTNNKSLTGYLTNGTEHQIIGFNSSNKISVDNDGYGSVFGGTITAKSNIYINGASTDTLGSALHIYDRYSNTLQEVISIGYYYDYVCINRLGYDRTSVMIGAISAPSDLYVTGRTKTNNLVISQSPTLGYYLRCSDVGGEATWSQIPVYKGTWNAATNTPTLSNTGSAGRYYLCTTAGTFNSVYYNVGDNVYYNGDEWVKISG